MREINGSIVGRGFPAFSGGFTKVLEIFEGSKEIEKIIIGKKLLSRP